MTTSCLLIKNNVTNKNEVRDANSSIKYFLLILNSL